MVIRASGHLNAKLNVEIQTVKNTNLILYEMPNSFSKDYGTHGILENNKIYNNERSGTKRTVPSDWSIWLVYNPLFGGGEI